MDIFIWYTGIYGLAWILVFAKPLNKIREFLKSKNNVLAGLLSCIVCTSFWLSLPFAEIYFSDQGYCAKTLLIGSNLTITWILANILSEVAE